MTDNGPVISPTRLRRPPVAVALDLVLVVGAVAIWLLSWLTWGDGIPSVRVSTVVAVIAGVLVAGVWGVRTERASPHDLVPWALGGVLAVLTISTTSTPVHLLPIWVVAVGITYLAFFTRWSWDLPHAAIVVWSGGVLVALVELLQVDPIDAGPYGAAFFGLAGYVVASRVLVRLWNEAHGIHTAGSEMSRQAVQHSLWGAVYIAVLFVVIQLTASDHLWARDFATVAVLLLAALLAWLWLETTALTRAVHGLLAAAGQLPWPADRVDDITRRMVADYVRASSVTLEDEPGGAEDVSAPLHPGRHVVARRTAGDISFSPYDRQLVTALAALARMSHLRDEREQALYTDSVTDDLTGLYDSDYWRRLLGDHLLHRADGEGLGVVFVDLDYFKRFNEEYGHLIGDEVLSTLGSRLRNFSRRWIFGRFGGDEFVGLGRELGDRHELDLECDQIAMLFSEPIVTSERTLVASGTVGRTFSTNPSDEPLDVLHRADTDLRRRKNARLEAPEPADEEIVQALLSDRLRVAYQPVVEIETGDTVGWEALLRGSVGDYGPMPPTELIAAAERIGALDDVMIRLAGLAIDLAEEATEHYGRRMSIALNLEHHQLSENGRLLQWLMARAGRTSALLTVELTERGTVPWTDQINDVADGLASRGVQLALDDFGAGMSRLNPLALRSWDRVKLDRGLLVQTRRGALILEHVVEMVHDLGPRLVLEGIETEAHLDLARSLGIEYGQGLLLGAPRPELEVRAAFPTQPPPETAG